MSSQRRQKILLGKIVKEYIRSAQPVSSQLIEEKYNLRVCPATIRNDMVALTEEGFLLQPHTSAGRVPTDKGYRFFVDSLMEKGFPSLKHTNDMENMMEESIRDMWKMTSYLSRFMAITSSSLATIHLLERDFFWKEGWEEVIQEPEFEEGNFIKEFAQFVKEFEDEVKHFEMEGTVEVYIGSENPLKQTESFSVIMGRCSFPKEGKGLIYLVGPKRMPYKKNISLINSIIKTLESL